MDLDKGLNRDLSPNIIPEGSWIDARNVLFSKGFKSIENEKGTTLHVEVDMDIIGIILTSDGYVVFSTDDTYSEIGVVREGVYTKKLKTQYLYFNKLNPIEGVYKYNYNNELVIAWTDATQINPTAEPQSPKILNLDNLPFKSGLTIDMELVVSSEITLTEFFPVVRFPIYDINYYVFGSGLIDYSDKKGTRIKVGTYYLAIAYYIDEYNTTNYIGFSEPIYITNQISSGKHSFMFYQKEKTGEYVSISLPIRIKNLSSLYKHIQVILLSKSSGSGEYDNTFYSLGKHEITIGGSNYADINITNVLQQEPISSTDVLIRTTKYNKVKTLTTLNNRLIAGNLETEDILNYQPYANNIDASWIDRANADTIRTPSRIYYSFTQLHFVPEEVYAFYIHFVMKDGSISPGYHIPGREITASFEIANGQDSPRLFFSKELLIDDSVNYYHVNDTSTYGGALSYWENLNEKYPNIDDFKIVDYTGNVIGDLRNTPVRHHKMPSLYRLMNSVTGSRIDRRIVIGFSNISITQDIIDKCSGYFFSMAKRNFNNCTIIGDGPAIAQEFWTYPRVYTSDSDSYIRFYNYSLQERLPAISPRYLKFTHYGGQLCSVNGLDGYGSGFGNDQYEIIDSYNYIPDDNSSTDPSNDLREGYIQLIPDGTYSPALIDYSLSEIRYCNLCSFIGDAYSPFYDQELLRITPVQNISFSTPTNTNYSYLTDEQRGDTFLNSNVIDIVNTTGSYPNLATIYANSYSPVSINTRFWEYRELDTGSSIIESPFNIYENNLDYYQQCDYGLQLIPYNPNSYYLNKFPYRLHISDKQLDEEKRDVWRNFLVNEYYESSKNKGVVWKLDNDGKDLLIEHQKATFVARIVDTIKTVEGTVAALGQAEIFDTKPIELIATNSGYVGCQSQFASFRSKVGNVIVDGEQGKIFLYKDGRVEEISSYWMKNFFKINLPYDTTEVDEQYFLFGDGTDVQFDTSGLDDYVLYQDISSTIIEYKGDDNPFNEKGIIAAWDDDNNRFIFSKKQIEDIDGRERDLSMTMSFDYNKKIWVSFHDYTPNYLFNNRYGIYSVKDNKVYEHNTGDPGEYYGTIHPAYIDVIFNNPVGYDKKFKYFSWVTEVLTSSEEHEWDKTFDTAIVYNYNQHSDQITLTKAGYGTGNIRNTKGQWQFNDFDDILNDKSKVLIDLDEQVALQDTSLDIAEKYTNWYEKSMFKGKFVILRLSYDNTDSYTIRLTDINAYSQITR